MPLGNLSEAVCDHSAEPLDASPQLNLDSHDYLERGLVCACLGLMCETRATTLEKKNMQTAYSNKVFAEITQSQKDGATWVLSERPFIFC